MKGVSPMIRVMRRELSQRDREDGFSLVELVVAMVVIAIVLMLLIGVQVSAISTVTEARKLQQATALANEAVEQMRALPWQVLSKGMYSGFLTASGGDPLVSGGYLTVDGTPMRILIAPSGPADQDITQPRQPLFDATGSHTQVRQDPSLAGVDFTVKAYVTEGVDSASSGTFGIAVVVEWPGADGSTERTLVRSTVHESGCGDPSTQPFLASCQDYFEASAGTGEIVIGLWATSVDPSDPAGTTYPLTTPDPHNVYRTTVSTAGVAAAVESQQVSTAEAFVQFGGHQTDDNDDASPALDVKGNAYYEIAATDDGVNPGGLPTSDSMTPSQGSGAESVTTISYAGEPGRPVFRLRSDYARNGSGNVNMDGGCFSGVPAGQPCATASLGHTSDILTGAGYTVMDFAGEVFRFARPLVEPPTGNSEESAWAARFVTAGGSSDTGCETLTGSGCVAAGAERTLSDVSIAAVIGGDWDDDAPDGLVIIEGGAGCANYTDSVKVQRGPGQLTDVAEVERCGTVRYWTDSGYVSFPLAWDSNATFATPVVTWTDDDSDYVLTATTQVRIVPGYREPLGSPDCAAISCSVTASPGSITITTDYVMSWGGHTHGLVSLTEITPPTASASYTAGTGD